MPLDVEQLPALWDSLRVRYADRDLRVDTIDRAVAGEFDVFDPDEERVKSGSPNMIQVALEDTAEAASLLPSVRVTPTKTSIEAKELASKMERIAASYLEVASMDILIPRLVMDMAAYGLAAVTITPDSKENRPLIERRDPRTCYPEDGYRPGDAVERCMFARTVYLSQLPKDFEAKMVSAIALNFQTAEEDVRSANHQVVLVEWYSPEETLVAGIYQADTGYTVSNTDVTALPVELKRIPNKLSVTPVVIASRITLDNEFRGQFDQVVELLENHIRLTGLVLDYADQAVYSDVWVKDLIGEMPYGGGAFIELGPQGAIGRVPPAVSSLNIQGDLQQLVDGIHLGGRWPKTRPGDIDQAIASAKFVESTAGMMNTAIRTYHQLLQHALRRIVRIAFETDAKFHTKKVGVGILRNQQFAIEYDPKKHIDLSAHVRVEYGLGLGRDPAQSAVLHIQYAGNEFISTEFVQENIDGLTDVARERARIDGEKLEKMALAKLLQGIETGMIPDKALVAIARKRADGDSLFDLFEEFVVKPAEELAAQQVGTGLGRPGMPGPPGMPPPGAPPGAGGPAGPGGPMAPPAPPVPAGTDLLARVNVPAGPGGTLGAQRLAGG